MYFKYNLYKVIYSSDLCIILRKGKLIVSITRIATPPPDRPNERPYYPRVFFPVGCDLVERCDKAAKGEISSMRSVLGITSGVCFVGPESDRCFVLKQVLRGEVVANERYLRILEALGDRFLTIPAWQKLKDPRAIEFAGSAPAAYEGKTSEVFAFAKGPGMPLGSFIIYRYPSLSDGQKEKFFSLMGKVIFIDALLGNGDRLYKTNPLVPSNLGNLLVQEVGEDLYICLIDNGSNLKFNNFPVEKYPGQRKRFFNQTFKQIASAISPYSSQIKMENSTELYTRFEEDAARMQEVVFSTWSQVAKQLDETCRDLPVDLPIRTVVIRKLRRIRGYQSGKPLLNHPPSDLPLTTLDGNEKELVKKKMVDWIAGVAQVAQSNGSPETLFTLRILAEQIRTFNAEVLPREVCSLIQLVDEMSNNQQSYHSDLPERTESARQACFSLNF
ncbi:MAG: hypothetical protein RLZZ453_231 [Chlamydiota bacterium]